MVKATKQVKIIPKKGKKPLKPQNKIPKKEKLPFVKPKFPKAGKCSHCGSKKEKIGFTPKKRNGTIRVKGPSATSGDLESN